MGKNVGDDLAEGKPTLPIIHALKKGSPAQVKELREVIKNGDRDRLEQVMEILFATKALEYTEQVALQEAHNAKHLLKCLPESNYKTALNNLLEFSVSRIY